MMKRVLRPVISSSLNVGTVCLSQFSTGAAFSLQRFHRRLAMRHPSIVLPPDSVLWLSTQLGVLPIPVDDYVAKETVKTGVWEKLIAETLNAILSDGDVFVEVGAHFGSHVLRAAKRVGSGLVIAVEPHPRNLSLLCEMLRRNSIDNVVVIGCALSDGCSLKEFYAGENDNLGQSSLRMTGGRTFPVVTNRGDVVIPVDVWTRSRALLLDVEGAEYLVLTGLKEHFERHRPDFVICEVSDQWLRTVGGSAGELIDLLDTLGYALFWSASEGRSAWRRCRPDEFPAHQFDAMFVQHNVASRFVISHSGLIEHGEGSSVAVRNPSHVGPPADALTSSPN